MPRRFTASVSPLLASMILTTALSACSVFEGPQAAQLQDDIVSANLKAELYSGGVARDARIDVAVDDGVVRLDGSVESQEQKSRAEQIARSTRGIRSVVNNLKIADSGS